MPARRACKSPTRASRTPERRGQDLSTPLVKRKSSATITKTVKRGANEIPTLDQLKGAIPAHCFEKSLLRSLACAAFDVTVLLACVMLYTRFLATEPSTLVHWAVTLVYWNVAGFYMWCLFVLGHDCGHTTFSEYPLVNDTVGWLLHSAILSPYFSWQESHRRHHMFHNSATSDYSHFWLTGRLEEEEKRLSTKPSHRLILHSPLLRVAVTPVMWWMYLLDGADDSHFHTLIARRLWKGASATMVLKCYASTAGVVAAAYAWWVLLGRDAYVYLFAFVLPEVVFGFWLVLVTYLQHHQPEVQVYDEDTWSYVRGAFETIDRRYGRLIDFLHHRISDCHLVHHLFFKQIPHHRLREATDALEGYLHKNGYAHLYKKEDAGFFVLNFFHTMWSAGFNARLVTKPVRANGKKQ